MKEAKHTKEDIKNLKTDLRPSHVNCTQQTEEKSQKDLNYICSEIPNLNTQN